MLRSLLSCHGYRREKSFSIYFFVRKFMKKTSWFLLLGSLSFSSLSYASQSEILNLCKNRVNLLRKRWVELADAPQLDQGPTGLCYSYAASSYLDLWRDKHLSNNTKIFGLKVPFSSQMSKERTSFPQTLRKRIGLTDPHWMAYVYTKHRKYNKPSFYGGSGDFTLNFILQGKEGSCREDVMRNSLFPYTKPGKPLITTGEFYALTSWIMTNQNKIKEIINSSDDWDTKFKKVINKHKRPYEFKKIKYNGDFKKIFASLKPFLSKKNYITYFEEIFSSCFKKENQYKEINSSNLENYRICTRTEPNPLKQIKQVLNLLNRKEPIGFSYQSKVLYDKEIYKEKGRVQTNHVSVIVGKRVRNNKCELLVKNSWGNYCGYDWEC